MAEPADAIVEWSVSAGLGEVGPADLVAGYCERLVEAGMPLWRASVGADTLHPLINAQGHRWIAGEGVREEFYFRTSTPTEQAEWTRSPWYWMLETGELCMRRRLATGEGTNEFPLLAGLAAQGATDYWARIVGFGDRNPVDREHGLATSWASCDPVGFSERDFALIEATLPAFALAFKARMAIDTSRVLATTYLGQEAAERILRGEVERGQVRTVRKVLWFSDLVDFTKLADTLPRDQLLDLLNAYADCLVGTVHDHGGEVLKFMGDGILAVFSGVDSVCEQALDAAVSAWRATERLNRERAAAGLPITGFTLALHEGEVLFGNVGSKERLDFTVVGPAVNEVHRIASMSRSLDRPMLVSATFASACGTQRERLVSVGRYALKGVGRPQELFTIDLS